MKIIYSELFKEYPELVFGISTKEGGVSEPPYFMNMGLSVGDNEKFVHLNRRLFLKELSLEPENVTFQKQIHSDNINYVNGQKFFPDSDALYSDKQGVFLAVMIADCAPVFLYDPVKKVVAGIHSGWMGAKSNITGKTISELKEKHGSEPKDIIAFVGPCISVKNYEVGEEFNLHFGKESIETRNDKYFLDLKKIIFDQLKEAGLKKKNIEISEYCTFEDEKLFHSHRRESGMTGRMMGIIGIR